MGDLNHQLGELIKIVRQQRGLTQAEFAKRLKTSQSAINRIEHGKQNLSIKTLERISTVLDCQLIYIKNPNEPQVEISKNSQSGKLTITIAD